MKPLQLHALVLVAAACLLRFSEPSQALSSCGGSCRSLNDCAGALICISGKCKDDPQVGSRVCAGSAGTGTGTGGGVGGGAGCGESCRNLNDCPGQLICTNAKCTDDPDVGTHICSGSPKPSPGTPSPSPKGRNPSPPPPKPGTCQPSGTLIGQASTSCNTQNGADCCIPGKAYPKYNCSPLVTQATPAILTLNGFNSGEDGGGASSCDNQFHLDSELVVALSTGWFNNRSRCGKFIKIMANGKSVSAKVVDECDSRAGCDKVHAGQPPCIYNDVDASAGVWAALGISENDPNYGYMSITWKDS